MPTPRGTILVTGANGGLGSAIVSHIVADSELAAYHGLYTVRDASAPNSALRSALSPQAGASHEILSLDLSRLSHVREVAAAINGRIASGEIPPIRALVLTAGVLEFGR
jgi:NAD(P)-dependent dehydrogenase (short-subunit alcohol dehydrogenase family)